MLSPAIVTGTSTDDCSAVEVEYRDGITGAGEKAVDRATDVDSRRVAGRMMVKGGGILFLFMIMSQSSVAVEMWRL